MDVLNGNGLKASISAAWRLARHPQLLQYEIDLVADYYSFRRNYGFLGSYSEVVDAAERVLVVSLTNWVAQVKMEAMLAKSLQLRGYIPYILTNRASSRSLRYFRIFGYDEFVFFDDLLQSIPVEHAPEDALSVLDESPSFRELLSVQYRNVNIGRHVLSTVVRKLRQGSLELSDPTVTGLIGRLFPQSMRSVLAAELLLDKVRPRMVLFLEKGYTPYGEIFDVAVDRGINTVQFLHSHRSDALVLKRYTPENRNVHPFSLSRNTWRMVREMPWTARHESELMQELKGRYKAGTWFSRKYLEVGKKLKNAREVREQLDLDTTKKTAIIFSHVLWDATFFYGENLFDDYEQWLLETVKVACRNSAVNWVIKIHPDYVWKMRQLRDDSKPRDLVALSTEIDRLPEHIRILEPDTDISTFSLIDVTDYCVTVRGTIGIELSCFGIPVFTAGTGRYSHLGFTIDSRSREDYLSKLSQIQNFPRLSEDQTLLAKRHAYALLKWRPLECKTFEMVQMPLNRLGHPLDHNVIIRADCIDDIATASDLEAFAEWASSPIEADFLSDSEEAH